MGVAVAYPPERTSNSWDIGSTSYTKRMNDTRKLSVNHHSSPIEVWLSQQNMSITCTVVYEDETIEEMDVDSLSVRGAEREISAFLIKEGYAPMGRWRTEAEGSDGPAEVSRRFKFGGDEEPQ